MTIKKLQEVILVHLMDPLRPAKGGAIRYTLYLLKYLLNKEYKVTFLGTQDLEGHSVDKDIYLALKKGLLTIHYVSTGGNILCYFIKLLLYAFKCKTKKKNLVIHVQRPLFTLPFILLRYKFKDSHIVVTVHGPKPLETFRIKHKLLYHVINPIYIPVSRFIFAVSSAVIFVSRSLLRDYNLSTKITRRSLVLPAGVDTNIFKPVSIKEKIKLRRKYCIRESDYVVLFVGRLEKIKRPDLLIYAIKTIISKGIENVKLIIAGDGPQYNYLKKLVKRLGIEENVLLPGFVPLETLVDYYKISDVLCLPSLAEASPNVVKEALACGIPFIATATSDEIVKLASLGVGQIVPIDIKPDELANIMASFVQQTYKSQDALYIKCKKVATLFDVNNIFSFIEHVYEVLLN